MAALLSLAASSAFANITGTVFRDYDADGVIDTGEPGLGGITVTAYDAAGTSVATATTFDQSCSAAATPVAACTAANTPALGSYTLVIASGGPFRVEFTGETGAFATAAFGSANPTSVQFVATSTATANAGFNNPAQYCAGPTPPSVVAGFFAFGNQTPGLTTLFGFDYDARGIDHDADPVAAGVQAQRSYGLSDQTGAIYGIAYQRRTRSLFSATYMHRGSPLGSTADTGTIYLSSNVARGTTNINAAPFITVNGLAGIDTGANSHPAGTDWNLDAATYGVVGKRGLGDLEISEDGLTLYTINLFQRELLVLPIGTGPTAPTAAQIVRVPVPVPASCSGAVPSAAAPSTDDIRPFATKYFDGTLYVGMVCTAQSMRAAGATLDNAKLAMRAYVYAMNPATNTFAATPIIEFPLNYPRRFLNNGIGTATTDGEWNPWNDTFQPADAPGSANFWLYPQPIFTDLEFDAQGRMAIGLRDRLGDQAYDTADIGPLGNQNDGTRQGGDLLLACRNGAGGSWVLENAGACGTSTTSDPNSTGAGTNINSGPGNREFYWEEYYDFDFNPDFHRETAMGSLLWRPGSGNFMSTVYDVDGTFNAGVRVYSNTNGSNVRFAGNIRHEFRLYEDGTSTFGKAGGIGDIEILCEDPPVELGNRVWRDSNRNGRQDPGEPAIAGVVVNLYTAAGALLGTSTTDATGHFLFLFSIGATDPSTADNTVIQPNPYGTSVTVLVAPSNFNAGGPLAGFTRTVANTGGVIRDSNGVAVTVGGGGPSGTGFVATVGQPGRNDHTIDFGFGLLDLGDLPDMGAGSGVGNYSTLLADNGAAHGIIPGLQMGATVDGEADGQPNAAASGDDTAGAPDDEDGVTVADLSLRVAAAPTVRVNATNTSGAAAQLCGFIDFNGDGDFLDAGESAAAVAVPNGSNNVQFNLVFGTVPAGSAAASYARFRLSDTIAACSAVGTVGNGEVEDYPVGITALDFGDLPDAAAGTGVGNYNTQEADAGARHPIVAGLFLGASVDAEANGQQNLAASGDDIAGVPDDEDGVTTADLQFVAGSPATVRVNATNLGATAASLCGFVDFNGDGDFADANEAAPGLTVAAGTNNVQFTLNFGTAPAGAASTYARFRLATPTGACTPNGLGGNGEVEDYPAGVIPADLGDLPDTSAGIGAANYSTLIANGGPRHPRTATAPRLGATVDAEADGQPNLAATGDGADEDGVTIGTLLVGANATIGAIASNPGAGVAQLCGFLDFNGDGDFADAGETAPPVNVAAGTVGGSFNLNFGTVPVGAATSTYARFRISSGIAACTPDGLAVDGEVEDYAVAIGTLDLGDLPDPAYPTLVASNGARHPIVTGLRIGADIDAESNGQPNAGANGDDANGTPDDEDGVTITDLSLVGGSGASVRVNATNTTGGAAQLCGFIDFNGDGDLNDAGEAAPAAAVPNGSNNVQFTLNFGIVPTGFSGSTYARFRLSTDAGACVPTGLATNGEVEDYTASIGLLDFGDLPDTAAGSGVGNYSTLLADNGPRHPIVAGLRIGANEDGEADGQPSVGANGDDGSGVPDDEDGVVVGDLSLVGGSPANVRVNATNTTGAAAQLCGFIDFNGDGDFNDAGETAPALAVATGSNNVQFTLAFGTVPGTAATSTYSRFRLSTDTGACSPVGAAPDGEVEDNPIGISQTDFGDLPDTGAGNGAGNYATLLSDNGPRHPIVAGLQLGANEDGEADGQQSAAANGDDAAGTPDDEDGVNTADLALTAGTPANVRVTATNTLAGAAQLCGFIDFNADGDFADAGETAPAVSVPAGSNAAPFTLAFGTVPTGVATSSFARFRLSTDAGACSPTGAATDGEVEDYPVSAGLLDFGDLPDTAAGTGVGNYATLLADDGPRHPIVAGLRLGADEDGEAEGQPSTNADGDDANGVPDDEDGVTIADLTLTGGSLANVRVNATNTSGTAAQLCGFIDFNGDGDFADAGESAPAVAVAAGSNNVQFSVAFGTVPTSAVSSTYARFRLSTDATACTATGIAANGEVEDYAVSIGQVDYGDLPDTSAGSGVGNYATLLSDNGPRHPIVSGLRLGANEDGDADGQPGVGANGDDTNGTPDDEDGVTLADLALVGGTPANVRVNATNTTGTAAQLCGFIDFNGDGDFADAGETATAASVATGSNDVQFTLNFGTVPVGAAASSYARFRLSTDTGACSANGAATDGEVEDYPVSVGLLDFGDLPDTGPGSGTGNYSTVLADNGPRHPIVTGLFLGATEDGEADGQPNVAANGDGADEDGVTLADLNLTAGTAATIRVNATNTTGSAAQICAFVDFNGNGSFADAGETASVAVPTGSTNVQFSPGFTVPANAVTASYARFRLSTDAGACTPLGQATDGEVEDYPVGITLIDFGDLPDTGVGSGTGNYSTLLADNGARHPIVANLAMGAGVDAEANGQPTAGANGDDANGTPDDEDGVNTADLALQRGVAPAVRVTATNGTGAAALLCGYLDYNADGDFADAGEAAQAAVPNGSTAALFTLNFGTVPNSAAAASYARFRLSTDAVCSPAGPAANGEVEDYPITSGAGVLSLGNLVWNDRNNNGLVDGGENGISTVTVVLYRDSDNNGTPDGAAIATTSTDGNGNYLFAALDPDTYLVEITPPAGYRTSTGSGLPPYLPTGTYEPAPDPDNDVNNDDNGTLQGAVIRSAPVTLSVGGEPVNDGDADANSNLSVDFGLVGNFDLALRKSLTAGQPGPFLIGQDVSFDITVFNQGAIQATTIVVNDYIPAGFALSPSETNWTSVSPTLATRTIAGPLAPGASTVVTILLRIQSGAVSPLVNRAEIGSADDDGNAGTPPPIDVDSTPDGNPNNDAGGAPGTPSDDATGGNGTGTPGGTDPATDEDDADPAQVTFGGGFDLALRKIVSAGQPGPFAPGQDIRFDIEVFNQGSLQATTIVVNDYIPAGFALSPSETNWTSVSPTLATRTIAGPLAPGASTVVTILLRIQPAAVSPLVNRAEIGSADDDGNSSTPPPTDIDSTPDGNPGNDAGGAAGTPSDDAIGGNGTGTPGGTDPVTDEDDADPAEVSFGTGFDLALRKRVSAGQPGPFAAGQDVSFDIEVFNQGTVQATTMVINDYIPAGFELSPTELNWSPVSASLATRTISGPLLPGASTVVTITLRILPGAVSPLVNRAEIGSADDDGDSQTPPPTDIDSTPDGNPGNDAGGAAGTPSDDAIGGNGTGTPGGTDPATDEDDADPAQIVLGPPGVTSPLGVAKQAQVLSLSEGGAYGGGGTPNTAQLAYVILLRNYGTQPVDNLQVVENLVSTFGAGSTWSVVSVTAPTLSLNPAYDGRTSTSLLTGTDTLAAGATTTIRLVVNVQFTAGLTYVNQVVGSGFVASVAVSDLSHDGTDPAPGGNPNTDNTPTGVRLGTQSVPALSTWSLGLLLLGLGLIAARQSRRLRVHVRA
ncbi:GEVED domain-containing protein [Tahibacter sp.]|uniref:GEVED domain-containing protein n=1 Tax=Tahibacter sp. TaxID=2056211 RepID=UPI0028C43C27|nr:GEVED domain-containing protein [Tahibacter sp.]